MMLCGIGEGNQSRFSSHGFFEFMTFRVHDLFEFMTFTACVAPKSAGRALRSAGRGKRMIFAQMAGLLAMPTLLPEGVLSAEGEDAQAVNSS